MREINVAQTVLEGLTCMHADSMYHIFSPVLFLQMHESKIAIGKFTH